MSMSNEIAISTWGVIGLEKADPVFELWKIVLGTKISRKTELYF